MAFNPADYEVELPTQPVVQPKEPDDRMAHAMHRLTEDYNWSPEIAAGIVGNLWHESDGGQPHIVGDGGQSYGLAQWNGPRRQALADYATKKGKPMDDFDVQIDFVNHELATSYPHVIDKLWEAKSPVAAAMVFSNMYEKPGTPMMGSRIAATRQAYQKVAPVGPEMALEDCTGSSCGDALANYMNSGPLKGTGIALPKGGVGPGELASAGKAIGASVYNKSNLSLDTLTPGTVIHMTRRPGDRNYTAGATHIGIVDVDDAGETVFKSFTPGKGWKTDRVDQQFIARLPAKVTATNLINPDYEARASKVAYATGKFNPDDYVVETGTKFNPDDYVVEQPQIKYGVTDAIGDMFGDAYNYVKDVLSPGENKDLQKAKTEFLKKNPNADATAISAAQDKLEKISAAHQMPLREAFSKNVRDFVSGIITPVQGVAEAVGKRFESFGTGMEDVQRNLGLDRKVGPGRYGTEGEGEEPPGMIDATLRPEDEKRYSREGLVRAPGRVLGTLVPYVGAGKVAQAAGMALTPASTFYEKLLFNAATFMPVDLTSGYKEAGMAGVDKALWHSPITAALFTVGGLPSGKVTGTVGVGLAGAGSAAAAGERDPAKLAEAFGTMAILHNILGTKPERAVKDFIKENNVTDAEVRALQDKLEGFRKQYAADRATPEQRAPEPTPEEVQAGVEKLKQEYVAGEEAALVTPADLAPEVVDALRKGQPLSPSQDIVLQDKIKAALIGQRSAPESVAWEQHGFSPEAPGALTPRTMASGAEPNVPGPTEPVPGLAPLSDRANEAAKLEGQAIAEQQAFKENFKRTYDWYEQIKAERGVEAADEALRNYREELRKDYEGTPVSTAANAVAAEQARLAAREGKRQAGIEDEGVTPMYSGGPDTTELMQQLPWRMKGAIHQLGVGEGGIGKESRSGITFFRGADFKPIAEEMKETYKFVEKDVELNNPMMASSKRAIADQVGVKWNQPENEIDRQLRDKLTKAGYDGWVIQKDVEGQQRVTEIADFKPYNTAIDSMYSGGPDTSELMRKLAPVWYSRARNFIGEKLPNMGTGPGLANTIQNWISKGVMPGKEEVKWTGVVPWLQERKGKVTRKEVVDFLEQNGVRLEVKELGGDKGLQADKNTAAQNTYGRDYNDLTVAERADLDADLMADSFGGYDGPSATKFESYVTPPPGSTNYREFYGVWPTATPIRPANRVTAFANGWLVINPDGVNVFGSKIFPGRGEALNAMRGENLTPDAAIAAQLERAKNVFQVPGGHQTGDPSADINRVFHVFTWDQVINGKKYLVIGELQVEWNRKLDAELKDFRDSKYPKITEIENRLKGELPTEEKVLLNKERNELLDQSKQDFVAKKEAGDLSGKPLMPLWGRSMEVAMKKMLRQASEEGYDGLAWVSGDVVKERYDLGKVYSSVTSERLPSGEYEIWGTTHEGQDVEVGVFKDAKAMKDAGIAEDMAEKLVKNNSVSAAQVEKEFTKANKRLNELDNERVDILKKQFPNTHQYDIEVALAGQKDRWTDEFRSKFSRLIRRAEDVNLEQKNERNHLYDMITVLQMQKDNIGKVVLTGVDLKLGGEWANKQYDSVNPTTGEKVFGMPVFMDKYGKQWGARVGESKINEPKFEVEKTDGVSWAVSWVKNHLKNFGTKEAAENWINGEGRKLEKEWLSNAAEEYKGDKVHTLDITPKMKETVLEQGQYMFSGGPDMSEWFKSLFRTGNASKVLKGMTPAQLEVASRISVGDHEKKTWTTPTDIYTAIMDRYHPLKKYMEQYDKLPQAITDNVYKLARLFEGWTGKAEAFVQYHPWDRKTFEFKQNVKGLADILKPIDKAGDTEQFRTFLVARRAVERAGRGFETGVDLEAAGKTVSELGQKFGEAAAQYDLYTDSVLQYARDAGLISDERYGQIKESSTDYAPLLRVMELESKTSGGKGFSAAQVIKQFKGSEREIIDPLESTVRLTYALVNAAERNSVVDSLIRWAKKSGAFGDSIHEINANAIPIDVQLNEVLRNKEVRQYLENSGLAEKDAVIFRPSAFQPSPNTISVWEGGERKFYNVPKEVADVVKGMSEQTADIWMRLLSFPAQALRLGATTLSPEFGLRNFLKDQFPAFIHSKYGYKPFIDYIRGVTEMARGGEQYWQYMISGAPHGELVSMDRRLLQNKLRDVLSGKLSMPGFLVRHPIEAAKLLSEYSERGTRIGEFKKGVEFEGATPEGIQTAGYQSREVTVDFGRKGAVGKFINMTTAFWNPGLQGINKVVRAHRENLLPTMAKAIAAVTIPSMLLEAAFGDDPRYQNLSPWRKDLFFNIPTKYGTVSLPKPWTYGLLYGAIPQRIMRSILEKDPHAYDGLLEAVGKEVPDFPLPTAITPFIEIWANKRLFTGSPLMSEWKKELPAKFQFSGYTPETMKAIGDMVSNIPVVGESWMASPVALNHLLLSWTGGTGRMFTDGLDYSLRKSGVLTVVPPPAARLADTPVVRAFFARYPSLDAEPLQRFRNRTVKSAAKMRFLTSQVMDMAMEGKQHQLLPLINELGPDTAMNLGSMTDAFNEMSKFAHLIERSKDMSPEQKRETIDRVYLAMIAAAKQTNTLVDKILEQSKGQRSVRPEVSKPDLGRSIFRQ